jgi:hypothetical protein
MEAGKNQGAAKRVRRENGRVMRKPFGLDKRSQWERREQRVGERSFLYSLADFVSDWGIVMQNQQGLWALRTFA